MKSIRAKDSKKQAEAASSEGRAKRLNFEWPLLIYPVLFLITLAILYTMKWSIERDVTPPSGQTQTAPPQGAGTDRSRLSDAAARLAQDQGGQPTSSAVGHREPVDKAPRGATPPPASRDRTADTTGQSAAAGDRAERTAALDRLQGPARLIAMLQMAVDDNDHARLKECMDALVALGDVAVVPLNDLISTETEASLWAAEALARIGTPMAASVLLDRLARTKEGTYKEELGKRVSTISNHDSWPILLDHVLQSGDATVQRAATASLSRMADTPVVDAIVAHYGAATTEAQVERLTRLISDIESPQASEALRSLAGDISTPPQDSLQEAAIEALANVADAPSVSHLLRRLEASPPGEGTEVFNAITRINRPEAYASLLYAAAGNKEVSAEAGQTAAIYALKNFPSEQTLALLERIVAETENDKVQAAAARTLDDVKQAPHLLTAKADPMVKDDYLLPPPMKK